MGPHVRGRAQGRLTPEDEATPLAHPAAPVIVVHCLAHAVAALEAAAEARRPVAIASAPEAGIYGGAEWFAALVRGARERVPEAIVSSVLDCGDDAGAALAAIRMAVERIVFTGRADVAHRLADIARQQGVGFATRPPLPALDLGAFFFDPDETLRARVLDALASIPQVC